MQIIIATGLLLVLGAVLVHQFWTRSLDDELAPEDPQDAFEPDVPPEELKAA